MIRRIRAVGLEAWFAPRAKVLHQIPASRLTLRYAMRHAFDSARSRVFDNVRYLREAGNVPFGFLASRAVSSTAKLLGYAAMALACAAALRTGSAKRALVRAWRCCGYLYQIARSAVGMV
jgi:hypothetical protein